MHILVGHDAEVGEWVGQKLGNPICPPYTALGWIDGLGWLRVGFVFHGYIPNGNIYIDVAASGRFTRDILQSVAWYVFNSIRATRMTAMTKRSNVRAAAVMRKAGFVQECVAKNYYPDDDALQFRMRRQECRWLKDKSI